MKQLKTVFSFELKGMFRNKSLIITTIIMCALSLIITTIPSFIVWFGNDAESNESPVENYGIVYQTDELNDALSPTLGGQTYANQDDLKDAVSKKDLSSGFIVEDFNRYTYVSYDRSNFSPEQMKFESQLKELNENRLFSLEGMDAERINEIINEPIESDDLILGKDAASGTIIAFAVLFIMYMLILLYGTNVATSVAREKDSRTMELLITATRPRTLILGKVAAAGLMGIFQISSMLIFALIGFMLNKVNYPDLILSMIQGSMTLDTLFVYILFSLLGYILYLFIYASLGSLVSKVEHVSSSVAPITYLFILAYLAATFAMQMPDNLIIKITSFIPFISLFTMPIRYMLTSVPLVSILASSVIMIGTVILFAALSIYIYRFGSLNYGNRIRLKEVFKSFRR